MKRLQFLCLFIALLLPLAMGSAAAESGFAPAQLREQAAQGWHQTYEAYGRTIAVDIPVRVPDADQYPVLKAVDMQPLDHPVVSDWADATLFQHPGFFRLDSHSPQTMQAISLANRNDPPIGMDVIPVYREINQLDLDTAYAYNNPSTVRKSQTILETVWADNFPDIPIQLSPYAVYATGELQSYDAVSDTYTGDPWPYQGVMLAHFHQVIGNIPVLYAGEQCFKQFDTVPFREGNAMFGATAITQKTPDEKALYYSAQYTLLHIQETMDADLPLCGLDQVIQSYERLIRQGLLRQVSSLELGYVVWKNGNGSFTLVPAWTLTGYLYPGAATPTRLLPRNTDPRTQEYGVILVSAQNGALLDPAHINLQKYTDR